MLTAQQENVDYSITERVDGEVWCKFSLDTCRDMMQELDHRNPESFGIQAGPDFFKLAEIEVIENQLRVIMKHYKNAMKKKSPFSAWKSVFAHLEALTLFIKSKDAWVTTEYASEDSKRRALNAFNAFGAAWISTADRLVQMASFSESFVPSVRSAVHSTISIGTTLSERIPRTSRWHEKLESLYTGVPLPGEQKKKESAAAAGDGEKKKASSSKKKKNAEEDDDVADDPKSKRKHAAKKDASASAANLWDFEEAVDQLKAGRKQIGGSVFDIAVWPEAERERIAAAAVSGGTAATA